MIFKKKERKIKTRHLFITQNSNVVLLAWHMPFTDSYKEWTATQCSWRKTPLRTMSDGRSRGRFCSQGFPASAQRAGVCLQYQQHRPLGTTLSLKKTRQLWLVAGSFKNIKTKLKIHTLEQESQLVGFCELFKECLLTMGRKYRTWTYAVAAFLDFHVLLVSSD